MTEKKLVELIKIHTYDNLADVLTKMVPLHKFSLSKNLVNVTEEMVIIQWKRGRDATRNENFLDTKVENCDMAPRT